MNYKYINYIGNNNNNYLKLIDYSFDPRYDKIIFS